MQHEKLRFPCEGRFAEKRGFRFAPAVPDSPLVRVLPFGFLFFQEPCIAFLKIVREMSASGSRQGLFTQRPDAVDFRTQV
jgi:hypothetical protein